MSSGSSRLPIAVVGAGPVGLTAACLLARYGAPLRIFEKKNGPTSKSKALGIMPKTLEVFDDIGVVEDLMAEGHKVKGLQGYIDGYLELDVSFDELNGSHGPGQTHYPFALTLEQSRTEEILLRKLTQLAVNVEWNKKVTLFGQDKDKVELSARNHDGSFETVNCSYVVACDGHRSTIRDALGLSFKGVRYPMKLMLADVKLNWELDNTRVRFFFKGSKDMMIVIPFGNEGYYRLVFDIIDGPSEATWPKIVEALSAIPDKKIKEEEKGKCKEPAPLEETIYGIDLAVRKRSILQLYASPADVDHVEEMKPWNPADFIELQRHIARVCPIKMVAHNPLWLSTFRIHMRIIEKYREGNVLFAGDAAHVNSPVGAQGLNMGIQDVANLTWKLALVWRGIASPHLLDSYDAERRKIAKKVLMGTDEATRMAFRHTFYERINRKLRAILLQTYAPARRALLLGASQLGAAYVGSPIVEDHQPRNVLSLCSNNFCTLSGKGVAPGNKLPDFPIATFGVQLAHSNEMKHTPLLEISRFHQAMSGCSHHVVLFPGLEPSTMDMKHMQFIVSSVLIRYWPYVTIRWVIPTPGLEDSTSRLAAMARHDTILWTPLQIVNKSRKGRQMEDSFALWIVMDTEDIFSRTCVGDRFRVHVVRPDHHVAYRSSEADPAHLLAYLGALFVQ